MNTRERFSNRLGELIASHGKQYGHNLSDISEGIYKSTTVKISVASLSQYQNNEAEANISKSSRFSKILQSVC